MKEGRTLVELAKELERQVSTKKDYIADTKSLSMENDGSLLKIDGNGTVGIKDLCHNQIANRVSIPIKYYRKMREEAPELLSRNVNHWFNENPEKRMVRTMDGKARAFLSERYRPLDNFDLAESVLPKITEMSCEVVSAEITDSRMYIKVVTKKITAEVRKGDVVQSGLVISNSEVGLGSVKVEPLVYRLVCLNGAIVNDFGMKKYHVGRGIGDMEFGGATQFFRDETRTADDKAFWMKVKDVVAGSLDAAKFELIVDKLRTAAERKITNDPVVAVDRTAKRFGFTDKEQGSVLTHLIEGGDLTSYGLHNAVTRASQDIGDYDRATEFERVGGAVIELPSRDWQSIIAE